MYIIVLENVNGCPKNIGLGVFFLKKKLWKNDKLINFFDGFYIFNENGVKTFLI